MLDFRTTAYDRVQKQKQQGNGITNSYSFHPATEPMFTQQRSGCRKNYLP